MCVCVRALYCYVWERCFLLFIFSTFRWIKLKANKTKQNNNSAHTHTQISSLFAFFQLFIQQTMKSTFVLESCNNNKINVICGTFLHTECRFFSISTFMLCLSNSKIIYSSWMYALFRFISMHGHFSVLFVWLSNAKINKAKNFNFLCVPLMFMYVIEMARMQEYSCEIRAALECG